MRKGFAAVIVLILVVVAGIGLLIWLRMSGLPDYRDFSQELEESQKLSECGEIEFNSPVDISLVSSLLYPGQIRGDDYKPHGGFRFDNREDGNIEVRAIMEGKVEKISRYETDWGEQKLLFYVNDCGIMVMHDHLVDVEPKLKDLYDSIPLGKVGDSRTTDVSGKNIRLGEGELIATSVGFENFPGGYNEHNIFVDFGLYDLTNTNAVIYSDDFKSQHPNVEVYGTHALCWFDYLVDEDRDVVQNLVDSDPNFESDYCEGE